MEVWGAQGGNGRSANNVSYEVSNSGGRGGYSIGNKQINASGKLYIVVGGKGSSTAAAKEIAAGGYNGGGNGSTDWDASNNEGAASGGGATHIATATGLLNSLVPSKSKVLIVAGGGGGGAYYFPTDYGGVGGDCAWSYFAQKDKNYPVTALYGGYGGGISGQSTYSGITKGGEQSGSTTYFGKGQDGITSSNNIGGIGGGGGGWYGGTIVSNNPSALPISGSGGSSYVGGVNVGRTIAGNANMPSPTGGTETGHSGNGYCKITWHPAL